MSERDISPGRAQKLWVSTPEDRRKVRSRPALLEGRASDCYHSNQQVIIEFCQGLSMVSLTSGSIRKSQDNPAVSAQDGQSVWGVPTTGARAAGLRPISSA